MGKPSFFLGYRRCGGPGPSGGRTALSRPVYFTPSQRAGENPVISAKATRAAPGRRISSKSAEANWGERLSLFRPRCGAPSQMDPFGGSGEGLR